jgi:SpoVK/Ycf46/Vps4 family AAA+-type ATPase
VLFVGASGTGKTLAAEVVAAELGLDMYRIDLSTVVSRYVGDMEGHLSTIFREAEESQCLLFFDEADALFGKRTEMKDAHDRYANIEVDFLLQRLELFDGIVVLATNMRRNMDDAFVRRLNDILEFVEPDERARERIWRGHFPSADLCEADVDVRFLARQFKLTGGSIRNVVLDAAFRAAAEARRIRMLDLLLSVKAELAKHGRLPTRAEFDRFHDLVQPEGPRPDLPVGR